MIRDDFKRFINALRFSYEMKAPPQEIEDFWFSKCAHIPDASLEWIRDRIKSDYPDRFPKHFQDVLTRYWFDWLRAHPDKSAPRQECPECDLGWVVVEEKDEMYLNPIPVAYACGRCNAAKKGVKQMTNSQARAQGIELSREVERNYFFDQPVKNTWMKQPIWEG